MTLDPDELEVIAERVAELVSDRLCAAPVAVRYVDAATVARALGVERDWVYAHARELRAIRLGGTQGRLRFDLQEIPRLLAEPQPSTSTTHLGRAPKGRRRAPRSTGEARRAELRSPAAGTRTALGPGASSEIQTMPSGPDQIPPQAREER